MNVRRRNARLIPAVLLVWEALLCVAVWLSPRIDAGNAEALRAAQSTLNAGYVGSETCAVCHQDQFGRLPLIGPFPDGDRRLTDDWLRIVSRTGRGPHRRSGERSSDL